MGLSLRNAAKEVGVTKSTILRAIQGGRLNAARAESGEYDIDIVELFRVYPPHRPRYVNPEAADGEAPAVPNITTLTALTAAQRVQIDALREALKRADALLDGLREDRDKWRELAESQNKLIQGLVGRGILQPD